MVYLLTSLGPEGRAADESELRLLARELSEFGGIVIEDTSNRYLVGAPRPPLLAQMSRSLNILTVGSMSKVFWGGLRVGWIRSDENTVLRLSRAKAHADLGTPLLSQLVSAWLLRRLDEVSEARIRELRARHTHARNLVLEALPEFTLMPVDGGNTLWLRIPRGASRPFVELARRFGVAVVPGTALSAGGAGDPYLRVALGASDAVFADGVERLARAWAHFDRFPGGVNPLSEASPLV